MEVLEITSSVQTRHSRAMNKASIGFQEKFQRHPTEEDLAIIRHALGQILLDLIELESRNARLLSEREAA